MFGKAIDEVSVADLQALVEARIPEGRRLEFKRDHYGRTDDAKREFAADVSAMANALGGHLLIGIEEENGIASKIVGVDAENPDALVRGITESIRASIEPPILGVRVRWMEIEATRGVLVIQVERSWSAPHRVAVARDNRFFLRDENGKHPMSVNELRRAFLFASEVDIVPQAAFTEDIQLRFDPHGTGIRPLGASGWNSMYSLDGLVTYSGPEEGFESVRAFSTLFRNGVVEAVAQVYTGERDGRRQLSLSGIEREIAPALQHILSELQRLSVPLPYYLMLSLVGVRGHCAPTDEWRGGLSYPHRSDKMLLPELMIDEALTKVAPAAILRPLFDLMWNGFGQYGSPNYDRDGNYRLR